jgi:hypothetical protein
MFLVCAATPDGETMIADDRLEYVHILRLRDWEDL